MQSTLLPPEVSDKVEPRSRFTSHASPLRSFIQAGVVGLIVVLLLHSFFVECFHISSGSMAPGLLGEHRKCICPACKNEVVVGKHEAEAHKDRYAYRNAFCPWCGAEAIPVLSEPLQAGDRIVIDKLSYLWRRPRRWERAVFCSWGEYIIKRILGLPGEEILIVDGDIYIDGMLVRKTWEEMESLRVLIFEQDRRAGEGKWESSGCETLLPLTPTPLPRSTGGEGLRLNGVNGAAAMAYRNFSSATGKCSPLTDEQAYNGSLHPSWENVHDFQVEVEVTVTEGIGVFTVSLFDGADHIAVQLPLGEEGTGSVSKRSATEEQVLATAPLGTLAGKFRLQLSYVDRRIQVRIDGKEWMRPIDLPAVPRRAGVTHPLRFEARGVNVECRQVRLYRDVHYTQAGENGVRGRPVRLQAGQYFVLGDNSGRSEDSRYWPNNGAIPEDALIGPALITIGH